METHREPRSRATVAGVLLLLVAIAALATAACGSSSSTASSSPSASPSQVAASPSWLGVFRRRPGSVEQPGCLPLLVTLLALVGAAVILCCVVYYSAGAYLGNAGSLGRE